MKWFFTLVLFVLFLTHCEQKEEVMEIDEDKIVRILSDLHVIEASLNPVSAAHRDSLKEKALRLCAEMNNIDIESLKEQIIYIDQRPEYQRKIYKQVMDTLESYMQNAEKITIYQDTSVQQKKDIVPKPSPKENEKSRSN